MKHLTYITLAFGSLFLFSCHDSGTNKGEPDIPDRDLSEEIPPYHDYTRLILTPEQQKAREANNGFAVNLFKDVVAASGLENALTSPFSLNAALTMAANGDDGVTRDQIVSYLGYDSDNGLRDANSFISYMAENLGSVDTRAYALVSNSVWTSTGVTLKSGFSNALAEWFDAESSQTDLGSKEGMDAINQWCERKTNGMIKDFLKEPIYAMLAIVNATYFKGMWESPFEKELTRSADFRNLDGSISKVNMMAGLKSVAYAELSDAQVLSLNYGNGNFRMRCILPREGTDFNSFVSTMTPAEIESKFAAAKPELCIVNMPKFNLSSRNDLDEILIKEGLTGLTSPGFNNMVEGSDIIARVIQQTTVSTEEGGTEGAAVTMVIGDTSSDPGISYPEITLDRPFIFIIDESSTGTILFMGSVARL